MIFEGTAGLHHAKHGCYICGRTDGIVNTEAQIEGEGVLAFCSVCVRDAARALGLDFNDAYVAELRTSLTLAQAQRDAAVARTERLDDIVREASRPARSKK